MNGEWSVATNGMQILVDEGRIYISVKCNDTSGNWGYASTYFNVDSETPAKVEGLKAEYVYHSIRLTWNKVSTPDFKNYKVYRSENYFDDVSGMTQIRTITTESFYDSNLPSDTTYYYGVTANDDYGNEDTAVIPAIGYVGDYVGPEISITIPENKGYYFSRILSIDCKRTAIISSIS